MRPIPERGVSKTPEELSGDTGLRPAILAHMKILRSKLILATCLFALNALAGDPTAFELVKEGNRHVGEDAKNKVIQIRSEKSVTSLTPDIWFVVYFDPDATFKATEVKFGAGKKMDVKRPARVLEMAKNERVFDLEKFKIDSPKALQIAQKEPLLKNLKLTNSQMWLENREGEPVWKIRLWAQKLRRDTTVDIGEVFVSPITGDVTKVDLHTNRID